MPKKIDPAVRERAVRLVMDHREEYPSLTAAVKVVAAQVNAGPETLHEWVRQAEVDSGEREGLTSEEHEQRGKLKAENRPLREDGAILKAATIFFVYDPAPADSWPSVRGRSGEPPLTLGDVGTACANADRASPGPAHDTASCGACRRRSHASKEKRRVANL